MTLRPERDATVNDGPDPSRLLIIVVGAITLLAVAYTAYLWGEFLLGIGSAGLPGSPAGPDFRTFSVAGSLARVGSVTDMYDPPAADYEVANAAAYVYVIVPALVLVWRARPGLRTGMALYGIATFSLLTINPVIVMAQLDMFDRALAVGPTALAVFIVWLVETAVRDSRTAARARDGAVDSTDGRHSRAMMRSLRSLETSPIARAVFWLGMGVVAVASAQRIVALDRPPRRRVRRAHPRRTAVHRVRDATST